MPSRYETFDTRRLRLEDLGSRQHLVTLKDLLPVGQTDGPFDHPALPVLADRIVQARRRGAAVVMMMGAHVIKDGLGLYVIDLIRRRLVDVLAMNGAGCIHDFELALVGATSEPVAQYIRTGQFGMWRQTGRINDIVRAAAAEGLGLGEAVGREIAGGQFPHADASILAAAYEAGVPATVHVGIGNDILHQHPNFDGAAFGACSGRDFLIYARVIERLEGGVMMLFGSAVMGPEVYLKALSMARNVARQEGRAIAHFTTAVFDLLAMPDDLSRTPPKTDPAYFYRPLKTVLIRTLADGGEGFYVRGPHRLTLPALHGKIVAALKDVNP